LARFIGADVGVAATIKRMAISDDGLFVCGAGGCPGSRCPASSEPREAVLVAASTATPIADPIGTGTVPRHAHEQSAVVPEVRWPPVLGVCRHAHSFSQRLRYKLSIEHN